MARVDDDPVCIVVPASLIANAHHDEERDGDQRGMLERLRKEHGECSPTECDISYLLQLFALATSSNTTSEASHAEQRRAWVAEKQSLLHVIYRVSGAPPPTARPSGGSVQCPGCFTMIPGDSPYLKRGRCPSCNSSITGS